MRHCCCSCHCCCCRPYVRVQPWVWPQPWIAPLDPPRITVRGQVTINENPVDAARAFLSA